MNNVVHDGLQRVGGFLTHLGYFPIDVPISLMLYSLLHFPTVFARMEKCPETISAISGTKLPLYTALRELSC